MPFLPSWYIPNIFRLSPTLTFVVITEILVLLAKAYSNMAESSSN